MLIFWVFRTVLRHLLALINSVDILGLTLAKMRRGRKILALVEVVEVRSIFVYRLRAFLILAWDAKSHIRPTN